MSVRGILGRGIGSSNEVDTLTKGKNIKQSIDSYYVASRLRLVDVLPCDV